MICDKCHAGQMIQYERRVGREPNVVTITGLRCDRCGFISLGNDEDVWSAIGL